MIARVLLNSVIYFAAILGGWQYSLAQTKAEILVLGTLHQFHETNKNYSFAKLTRIIEQIGPDVLAVELTPEALTNRTEQKTKQEYQRSIFPLIDKYHYRTVALEPPEPEYSRLVSLFRESNKENQSRSPEKVEAFSVYSNQLYDYLFESWTSPRAVNSPETDALFEVKHKFQNALFGEKEEAVWNSWNTFFLGQILSASKQHKGKRVLVLVGVEHAYWLRGRLRTNTNIRFREIGSFIK